ncbi:MAG: hypothetical protein JO129_02780 [Candidatus Dependentiae bacterium]|nr:hypothetical protein [Candidatus Dependentiae bacterium]
MKKMIVFLVLLFSTTVIMPMNLINRDNAKLAICAANLALIRNATCFEQDMRNTVLETPYLARKFNTISDEVPFRTHIYSLFAIYFAAEDQCLAAASCTAVSVANLFFGALEADRLIELDKFTRENQLMVMIQKYQRNNEEQINLEDDNLD